MGSSTTAPSEFDYSGEAAVQQARAARLVIAHLQQDGLQQAAVMAEVRQDPRGALVAALALLNALAAGLALAWSKDIPADELVAFIRSQIVALEAGKKE